MKAADVKWKIETFKQGKKNTADFMIEFDVLAMKADIGQTQKTYQIIFNLSYIYSTKINLKSY